MPTSRTSFVKHHRSAPSGFFQTEAAGLAWLGEATARGGAAVVEVLDVQADSLVLARLTEAAPSSASAHTFGRALAHTHLAGAAAFGALPPSAPGYFFGPLDSPIALPSTPVADFGTFYANSRLRPMADGCGLGHDEMELLERLCGALEHGAAEFGSAPVKPARVHGDLWNGNLMWTPDGAVLIDPAACGHHPLADIAMLMLFGAPHLDTIIEGYETVSPLRSGWRQEIPLHQLFAYLAHLRLFGRSYEQATSRALHSAAQLCGIA